MPKVTPGRVDDPPPHHRVGGAPDRRVGPVVQVQAVPLLRRGGEDVVS